MADNALKLITGVRISRREPLSGALSTLRSCGARALTRRLPRSFLQLVTVTVGFQLYKDANEFYFAHDCPRCDGTGKLVCNKCKGYGFLRRGPDDVVKAFRPSAEDVSNIYLCPFCKGTGVRTCTDCRGAAKLWPAIVNVGRMFKWNHVHDNAFARHAKAKVTEVDFSKAEAKRKVSAGQGAFKMQGNASQMPYSPEEPEDR